MSRQEKVLEALKEGPKTREDLVRITGMPRTTVHDNIRGINKEKPGTIVRYKVKVGNNPGPARIKFCLGSMFNREMMKEFPVVWDILEFIGYTSRSMSAICKFTGRKYNFKSSIYRYQSLVHSMVKDGLLIKCEGMYRRA